MTSLGDAVIRIKKAVNNGTAPSAFKLIAKGVRSPVDLSCEIVKWFETIDDEAVAALDAEIIRCCRTCATAVHDYQFHGLKKAAAAMLKRLPPPPEAANAETPPPKAAIAEIQTPKSASEAAADAPKEG